MLDKIKARLIDEWRDAWKFASVRLSALGFLLMALPELVAQSWGVIPDDLKAQLPYSNRIGMGLFVLIAVARMLKAKDKTGGTEE